MPYNTKDILRDVSGVPIPQVFDAATDAYVPARGTADGAWVPAGYDEVFKRTPALLAASAAGVYDIRGMRGLTIIPTGGATVTYSKVDAADAAAHDPVTQQTATAEVMVEGWPFIRVSVSGTVGHGARVAVV